MESTRTIDTIPVDSINISTSPSTTALPLDFVTMLGDQEILCHTEAGEIVPNTLDELVTYLDIEGFSDSPDGGVELDGVKTNGDLAQLKNFTTFGTEDRWPI